MMNVVSRWNQWRKCHSKNGDGVMPNWRDKRRGEAYWKDRSVIRREDDVDRRARVTKVEERVLRGG